MVELYFYLVKKGRKTCNKENKTVGQVPDTVFDKVMDMYVALVIAGRRTCNKENKKVRQVAPNYREAVLADLEALGLDADGKPIA